eukprot:m.555388 g.555388  ORF g.555388 m.555388 type:complete len:241 (-) comp22181_c0_seq32:2689-3411(-)
MMVFSKCFRGVHPHRFVHAFRRAGIHIRSRHLNSDSKSPDCHVLNELIMEWDFNNPPKIPMVLQSDSLDPYSNLAFEDWLSSCIEFLSGRPVMMLWRNRATVVVGRNQNVWKECDLHTLKQKKIIIARRKSGGGTVFHDEGNLNITFYNARELHDKNRNSRMIKDALLEAVKSLPVSINDRNDVLLAGKKISGSAYKLDRLVAYHHCKIYATVFCTTILVYVHTPLLYRLSLLHGLLITA